MLSFLFPLPLIIWEVKNLIKKKGPKLIKGRVRIGLIFLLKSTKSHPDGDSMFYQSGEIVDLLVTNKIIESDQLVYEMKLRKEPKHENDGNFIVVNIQSIDDETNSKPIEEVLTQFEPKDV